MGRETFELSLKIVHQKNKRNCVGHLYMSSRPNGMSSVVLKIAANHGEAQYILAKIYEMRGSDGVEVLRINSSFASLLKLAENSTVRCAIVDRSIVPDCRRAKAEISWEHWGIVGRNRRLIEHQLLQQIQLVRKGMKFPLHIRRNQVEITIVDVSLDQKNDEAIAFLGHSTELEIDVIPDANASPDVHSSYVCAPFSSRKETSSHQPMKGFLDWGQHLIASMTDRLLNRPTSVDDTEGYLGDIQESKPSKRALASQAAATARERQGVVSGSSYDDPEKLPHPIDRSGKLLRVQKRPPGLLETLEEMARTPEEKCLIRQPTTIFVSDWSFSNFSHNQRVAELLFSITVATETAKETTSTPTPTINDADEGTNGLDAVNGGGNGRKISTGLKKSNDSGGGGGGTGAIVGRLYICRNDELDESQQIQSGHVVVHDMIRRQLRARLCSLILVKPLDGLGSKVQGITLQSVLNKVGGVYEKDKRESFWWWLKDISCDAYPLPAVNGQLASISIKFQPMVGKIDFLINVVEGSALTSTQVETKPKYFLLKPTMEGHLHVAAQVDALSPTNPDVETLRRLPPTTVQSLDSKLPPVQLSDLGGIEDLAQEGLSHLCSCLTDEVVFSLGNGCAGLAGGGLLIAGTTRDGAGSLGIGKTSLAYALCREMTEQPVLAHIVTLECALLRGKGVGGVQKRLKAIFDDAASHQPSIVFLDNLDHLISAPTSGMAETAGDALYSTKLAQTLCDLVINELHRGSVIALIATSRSRDSLHPTLMPRRGQHVFKKVLELKAPNKARRKDILKAIARRKKCHILNDNRTLELVAQRTYGYGAQDLLKLIERTEHRSLASDLHRRSKTMMPPGGLAEPLTPSLDGQPITARLFGVRKPLTLKEFSEEIEICRPSSLRNVPLHSPGEKSWRDVGGLENIKTMLIETFEWPAKYPELFSKCPLRLRSGLLLYGAPGTGKTLIAGVVAKECGLNFISIKGPELLNKYIGASEEAVRSMFERAQAAQPCILFFDEFDSIAPKRGHDNTGVTDRVVNQFLTQLDGVEGLQGVYVLAATSRPDLIDPALLRPGRLDKSLFLPMPDEGGRTAILNALANDVALDRDVDVDQIASKTAFFSGADLKALLYNAQLESIRQSKDYALSVDRAPPTPRYQKGVKLGTFERKTTQKKRLQKLEERDENFVEGDSLSDLRSMYSLPSDVDSDGPKMDKRLSDVDKTRPKHLSLNRRNSSEGSIDVLPVSGYFMSSIADGVCEMSHEVEKQIKSKYSEYLKRQVGPEGRKMSFAMKAPPKFQHQSSQAGVRMEHIQTALLNMGPSLSEQDRAKYQAIYDRFGNRGKGETAPEHFQQKITHA